MYLLCIPAMYLLLIIYSITNLNVVSWGTREVQVKKTKKQLEEERKQEATKVQEIFSGQFRINSMCFSFITLSVNDTS